ncbi:MAG TPA: sigma 54-interacting transcriptional regulator [Gemmatimonadales bacterium]|nr:sigma 54-interacting transcriptional regulator [Gemmatimonadales bacterium]HRZ10425.1 sigma 54-interacting transcriptional regulator [Gemmatimonadales bacterium]
MVGAARWLAPLLDQVRRAAVLDVPVAITGETGTGKELVATALHRLSRRTGPLVALNVASLSAQLVESELFGTRRGAFTDATDRPGLIEAAEGGTLFLDEACELSPAVQSALLRVLETRRVRRVGDREERSARFRLLLALQQPAELLVRDRRWRMDFWHRVSAITIELPPLRERLEDVPLLVNHLLSRMGRPQLPREEIALALSGHDWPGNVRELLRVVERALFEAGDGPLTTSVLRGAVQWPGHRPLNGNGQLGRAVDAAARSAIVQALVDAGYRRSAAAAALGISVHQLYRRMKALGLTVHLGV